MLALLAGLVLTTPARAARVVEFSLACADSESSVSFIELAGSANETLDPAIGLRVLDRNGATLGNLPTVYAALANLSWFEGDRHFLIATPAAAMRFRYPGESPRDFPNNILPAPLDSLAGSIVLYRLNGTTETTIDRVDYGPGHVPAPPPGTSMVRGASAWAFQPAPQLHYFFQPATEPGRTDACYGFEHFDLSQMSLACEDGDARGQYLELTLSGPNVRLDPRLHVILRDHTGSLLGDMSDVFGRRQDERVFEGTRWLIGGPTYASQPAAPVDATLPVALDPEGGRIELSATLYGAAYLFDSFSYGILGTPAPAPGTAYSRARGGVRRVTPPTPTNSQGVLATVPSCALGASPSAFLIGELTLACTSGSPAGQFVEITATGSGGTMLGSDHLRAYARDGAIRFDLPRVFASRTQATLHRSDTFLLAPAGSALAAQADAVLPDTLDRTAGRLELVRAGSVGDTVLALLAWGDPPLHRPPPGSSLVRDLTGEQLSTYPTPTGFTGTSPVLPGCHLLRGPRVLQVDQVGLACLDGSSDGLFLELGALDSVLVNDPTLGLRLLDGASAELSRVLPLFPTRATWPPLAGQHWLVGGPAFAARAGDEPDVVLALAPHAIVGAASLFRRDPVTAAETTLATVSLVAELLAPGHAALRLPNGQYERAVRPSPRRLDGKVVQPAACWLQPRPEAVGIHSVFLRCRDGDTAGQYVELEATSPETNLAPELALRVFDRQNVLTGVGPMPYPPEYRERNWPAGAHVLVGAPGFATRFGAAPDAALPAVLDTVAGRVELVLVLGADVVMKLDEIRYGTASAPAPSAGTSLERTPLGLARNVLPSPSGLTSRFAGPTACLGECPARTVQFALGGVQGLAADVDSLEGIGARLDYDTPRGTFRLDSRFRELTVHWSDRYRVEGRPPGEPLAFEARVRTRLASTDSCVGARCSSSLASVTLVSADSADSAAARPDPSRTLAVPVRVRAGETFALDLSLRANSQQAPLLAALVQARLEFAGLPTNTRVVSCHGFDTRAQRGIGAPQVLAEPRQVTVRWPVTGPPGFSALVERRVDDGSWAALETRSTDPDGMLRIVDRTVLPEHRYRYRTGWSDEFATYTSPEAVAVTPRQPGFDFAGVRPNPARGELVVSLELPEASEVRFEVLDVAGRVVVSHHRWLGAGANVVPLASDHALVPGMYLVRLHYRNLVVRQRAVLLP